MVAQGGLILATSYPMGSSFAIQRCLPDCEDVHRAASLEELLGSSGDKYHVDINGRLYLKFSDDNNLDDFVAGGIQQLRNKNRFRSGKGARYKVLAYFDGDGTITHALPHRLPTAISPPETTLMRETTPVPDTTSATTCPTRQYGDCKDSLCCADVGFVCYEKNEHYAQCHTSCTPGIHETDAPEYQTPWSCKVLSGEPVTTSSPETTPAWATTELPETTLPPETTPLPEQPPAPACQTGKYENCRESLCCADAGFVCYEKDQHYAQCHTNCVPGIHETDAPEYQTPWSCKVLSGEAVTTSSPETTPVWATTELPETTLPPQ